MEFEKIRTMRLEPIVQTYDKRDTILYALGLGYGADPLDESELPFVYEGDLRCLPSYANLLCHPGFWAQKPEFGIDWVKILHAEQDYRIHKSLPPTGSIRGEYRVAGVEDKGAERGALLHQEKELYNAETGDHLATVRSTLFLRGDGGQGGFGLAVPAAAPVPERAPDRVIEIPTLPRQALIYRLSGDWNPLHADPVIARKAGFDAPILHGLCTNGIASRALLKAYCDNDTARLTGMFVRFSKPVMPGETIRVECFEEGDGLVRFRAIAKERNAVVLDRCSATVR
jgi:acyl dehydratase